MSKLTIYTDGGSRGNPGPAGIGVVVFDEAGEVIQKVGEYIGETTNNQAEYQALLRGIREAEKLGAKEIDFVLDSELVVKQMQGLYKIREEGLKPLAAEVLKLTAKFARVNFRHVPREKNKLADALVNEALDAAQK